MYWPDNEPFPDRGQCRPLGSTIAQYPPIINTGNKGVAEKQPGDWVCSKCNYLNWRRRKVCQTCYPYAEGNGDSISQAVQAERIALLTNVLNAVESNPASPLPIHHLHRTASAPVRASSSTPPLFIDINQQQHATAAISPKGYQGGGGVMGPRIASIAAASTSARSRSQMDLRTSFRRPPPTPNSNERFAIAVPAPLQPQPPGSLQHVRHLPPAATIYQTQTPSGVYRCGQAGSHPASPAATASSARSSQVPSPLSSANTPIESSSAEITPNAANLLPSFLHDLILSNSPNSNHHRHAAQRQPSMSSSHSIHSSPSTSASSWSLEEYDHQYAGGYEAQSQRPAYEYVSQPLYQSQPPRVMDAPASVRTGPTHVVNAATTENIRREELSGDVGVIGIGRPPRLNSSGSGTSTPRGLESIWKSEGVEHSSRVWKPAADSAPGISSGVYASSSYHSAVTPPRQNAWEVPVERAMEGYGHGLAGLDGHLAAHLTISGSGQPVSSETYAGRGSPGA
ncbi:hypothetical protein BC835DRAFT_1305747 [Cytidiella melzeri]|nr:hypothetical protein BC835DRAFT_1305747 [Cytidiella melzeri]